MTSLVQSMCSYQLPRHRAGPLFYEEAAAEQQARAAEPDELSSDADPCSELESDESETEPEEESAAVAADAYVTVQAAERSSSSAEAGPQFARELLVFYLFGKIQPKHGMYIRLITHHQDIHAVYSAIEC